MKRKLTAILSLCICAFLLVPALALAQEPVSEIQVLTYDNDFFDDVIADFESKNPDIKVIRKLGQVSTRAPRSRCCPRTMRLMCCWSIPAPAACCRSRRRVCWRT